MVCVFPVIYLYAGVGLGATADFSDEAILFPVFIDLKGYMPVTSKMDLIAGVDVGTKLDYTYDMSGVFYLGLSLVSFFAPSEHQNAPCHHHYNACPDQILPRLPDHLDNAVLRLGIVSVIACQIDILRN